MTTPRILVVDDSPTIRRVVGRALEANGYAVMKAEDGPRALVEAQAAKPDLILLDFSMPGMNGYQVVKALSEHPEFEGVPVVLMCTRADPVPEESLRRLGIVDFITKPFSPDAVQAVVSYSLEKHGVRRREETAPVSGLFAHDGSADDGARPSSKESQADEAKDATVFSMLSAALSRELRARGIEEPEAEAVTRSVAQQVAQGLASAHLEDLARQQLGVREGHEPAPSLYGDLAQVPLPEVLQLLKFQGQTGVLEVAIGRARYEAAFDQGFVVSVRAHDTHGDLRLGRYFVRAGALSREDLELVMRDEAPGEAIGQRLLAHGLINAEQLRMALGEQAEDLIYEILRAKRGVFALHRQDRRAPVPGSPGFSVEALLFEGLRRIDEWSVIEKEVPSFDVRVYRRAGANAEGLSPEEAALFERVPVDGPRSVRELIDESGVRPFDVCKLIYRLVLMQRLARADGPGHGS